ncbi:T9SS type B sorting domain-containing protein [Psychroflexus montanilacus]|uniref:T9SS type B sorting domain-containing protein n=1 Tax=Psychroflexus montanilacus TaxID=2873598 RepID=UPI001CCE2D02|nr:T9SS type B sorting domain-containing protein [Psychroflexus montanilacus]MBZ9652134.1 T9SS type B sorting domain-containing protein [Psychroflexus montanilacus]
MGPDIEYIPNTNLNSIGLGGRSTSFGLPPFIQSLFSERINIVNDDQDNIPTEVNLCDETEFLLSYNTSPGATYTWKKDGEILSDENGSSLMVEIPVDAEYPYEVTYQLEVNFNDGECPLIGIARLTFNQSPNYGNQELVTCRETTEDTPVYDFTDIYTQLSDAFDIPLEEISGIFYETEDDAINGENPITEISNFQNTTGISSIYAEMETFQSCKEIIEINLLVEEFPDIFLEDESLILCQENSDGILLDASGSEEENTLEYLWSTGETSAKITVNTGGEYTVDVSFQGFECALSKTFTVIESNIASFDFEVESSGNSNSIQIITDSSSLGEYEFTINEPVNFQDSSTFENLSPGVYQVYVRDQLGCGISEKTIGVLGIMEFFTPNGDGINDVWQISGLLQTNEEDILLQVYDRYGKLLSSFTNRDRGWDGTYNGKNMPTDDYWYRIRLTDGTIETGSFTLKR